MERPKLARTDQDVWFYTVCSAHSGHRVHQIWSVRWVSAQSQQAQHFSGGAYRIGLFVGKSIALSAGEQYHSWSHTMFYITSDPLWPTKYAAGAAGRSRFPALLFQKWVSIARFYWRMSIVSNLNDVCFTVIHGYRSSITIIWSMPN